MLDAGEGLHTGGGGTGGGKESAARSLRIQERGAVRVNPIQEARLSHLPFWGPSEAFLFLIKRPSG